MTAPGFRADGYMSALSALSPAGEWRQTPIAKWSMDEAERLYAADGIAALIVDRPAEDATARGFAIKGDPDNLVLNEMDRLDAVPVITDALRWARLYGAAAVLPIVDDGLDLAEPLDPRRVRSVQELAVYTAGEIAPGPNRQNDPARRDYGDPLDYVVRARRGGGFPVHASRLWPVSGDPLPRAKREMADLPWMGASALTPCRDDLARYRDGLDLARAIMERKQTPVYSMSGLFDTLREGAEGEDLVKKRLAMVDMVRSIFTTVGIDAGDQYAVLDSALGGVDTVLRHFQIALSGSSGIPVAILFGEDVKGLNGTGQAEQSIYHGRVRRIQERGYRPLIERLAGLIWAQSTVPAAEPTFWRAVFNPLFSPPEKEAAEAARAKAEARKAELEALGALDGLRIATPEELRAYAAQAWPEYRLTVAMPEMPELPDDDETDTDPPRAGAREAPTDG